ncbi:hypothetical protein [Virgibacillus salexigens]|uniref:Uncharacterized protein n=1 Tax=Virgibacillus massiliensis TaxID=1462526 RepID=A0A024QHT4_9BACI|nr:hypothetical protein [Virgibacillus massiliensis]CDQ42108.1 hypothetical protein BN990_04488 [Virgibacillus massiliensis]
MKKIKILTALVIVISLFPSMIAHAAITSPYVQSHGFNSSADGYQLHWSSSISQVSSIRYTNNTKGISRVDTEDVNMDGVYLRCNGDISWEYRDSNGSILATDSITVSGVQNPSDVGICGSGDDDGGGGGNDGGSGGCEGCGFINCPGWGEYMGKIDSIIGKIPSPPDWDEVAGTFRDTIAPRIKQDMKDLLGRAPSLPSKPDSPGSLDDGDLKKPTGQDSGLEGFDDSDIKDGEKIKEREDESGGFDILDPIESMPDQETFEPEEGDLEAPEVPDVEGEAPEPEEPENPTPENPEEPENPVPSPSDPDNPAPTPNEPENEAPKPEEPENPAPTPGEPSNPYPTPGDSENEFPIPGENNSSFPMPGNDSNQAPIPGRDNTQAPTPGKSNVEAPMPNKGG